ncbi:MAG: phospho-N-acetylmuramoyl-pentapeptide-transferase [Firmicutes bacterium]|nr:phospho-N-acetylmuramoyl-pentapeptide-transferase [Bacillota bacterium]
MAYWYALIFVLAVLLTLVLGKCILPLLIRLKIGQTIRSDGPQKHLSKAGTPTMGGFIFIVPMLILAAVFCKSRPELWLWLFSFLAFALIGCCDDTMKVVFHRSKGLSAVQKLLGQFTAIALLLAGAHIWAGRDTVLYLLPDLPVWDAGWLYYPLMAIFLVGLINAVNLTDGLDGLAAGVSLIVFCGYFIAFLILKGRGLDVGDQPVLACAFAGCCIGFLAYNHYPAKVFMGDTGSLALGGAIAGFALLGKTELLALGFGLIYLLEAASVMLQVGSYKLTGRRIFKMAPLHHHFEQMGWPETKVSYMFWLAALIIVLLSLIIAF